jgi:ribosomal protein S18 acetylase RimI-like enzyme
MQLQLPADLFQRLHGKQAGRGPVDPERAHLVCLHTDMGASFYLAADGRILVDDVILQTPLEEADRRGAISALILGARNLRSPELLSFLPPRTANAVDCVRCGGGGWWALPGNTTPAGAKMLCPDCCGLGWSVDDMTTMDGESYEISTDTERVDVDAVHAYLTRSYWAEGIPKEVVAKAIANSLCFSLFDRDAQIGFARVVTDRATFAYLCDVYVLEDYRGRGLGKRLIDEVTRHPDLAGVRRFVLVTRDAQSLYEPFAFNAPTDSGHYMEIFRPSIYKKEAG